MKSDLHPRHRRLAPATGVDYSHPGIFFVTLCTFKGAEIFGSIEAGQMHYLPLGRIARAEWFRSGDEHKEIQLFKSEFVVMPNHIHGIVWIVDNQPVGADGIRPETSHPDHSLPAWARSNKLLANNALLNRTYRHEVVRARQKGAGPAPLQSGSEVLASFLTGYQAAVIERAGPEWTSVTIWQANPAPHIIRNQEELDDIRVQIHTNPLHWAEDDLNPKEQKEILNTKDTKA